MHDWTASRAREDALQVGCRYCHAVVGEPCTGDEGKPLEAFPAHTVRVTDAQKASAS